MVVQYGKALAFSVDLTGGTAGQKIMVDYAVHFVKANGTTSPKVFKWKDIKLDQRGRLQGHKKHVIKPITTRTYYPGEHAVELIANGVSVAKETFDLKM